MVSAFTVSKVRPRVFVWASERCAFCLLQQSWHEPSFAHTAHARSQRRRPRPESLSARPEPQESSDDNTFWSEGDAAAGAEPALDGNWWDSLDQEEGAEEMIDFALEDDEDQDGTSDLEAGAFNLEDFEVGALDDAGPEADLGQTDGVHRNRKASDKGRSTLPKRYKRRKRPVVAIIGRPNVGKSAIANRISGAYNRGAIVHDEMGVTRDRTYLKAYFGNRQFELVDTGGLVFDDDESSLFLDEIRQQAAVALTEAAACILVVDGKTGLMPLDDQVARFLRRDWCKQLPVLVAVNKCESHTVGDAQAAEFWKLGLGKPYPVSGIHGTGVAELLEDLVEHLPEPQLAGTGDGDSALDGAAGASPSVMDFDDDEEDEDLVNVAIVGRPNVGKSSLFNRLFGEARAIVSDLAGTTRDTLDAELEKDGRIYRFIDTAGIRRRGKVQYGSEFFMVNRALKAIRRSDVVLLVLDATIGISDQDRTLSQRIADDGRACVVLLNKWDAVPDKSDKTYLDSMAYVKDMLPAVRWAPIVLVSALTGQRCPKIYTAIDEAVKNHRTKVSTSVLNEVLRDAILWQPPPTLRRSGHQGKIYYCSQIAIAPPTLAMFCNKPALFSDNYRRYLDRKFREGLGFEGAPIKFIWRGKRVRTMEQDKRRAQKSSQKSSA